MIQRARGVVSATANPKRKADEPLDDAVIAQEGGSEHAGHAIADPTPTPAGETPDTTGGDVIDDDAAEGNAGVQHTRVRGQNKKRKPVKHDANRAFCRSFIKTGACAFGPGALTGWGNMIVHQVAGCKFEHDKEAFLKVKGEDLPGLCPFNAAGSACEYGITCRFSQSHVDGLPPSAGRMFRELQYLIRQVIIQFQMSEIR